jgi:hypothetical protein
MIQFKLALGYSELGDAMLLVELMGAEKGGGQESHLPPFYSPQLIFALRPITACPLFGAAGLIGPIRR